MRMFTELLSSPLVAGHCQSVSCKIYGNSLIIAVHPTPLVHDTYETETSKLNEAVVLP